MIPSIIFGNKTTLWGYASGNFGKSTVWTLVEVFALFYFTEVIGLAANIAGTLIMLSLIWDAISDPLIAYVAEKNNDIDKTIRMSFVIGAPLTAISLIAMFLSLQINEAWRTLYIFITLICFRTAYSIVDVPHNSMLSLLTKDCRVRTNIASMRIFFSSIGRLTVMLFSAYLLQGGVNVESNDKFLIVVVLCSLIYLFIMALCLLSIKSYSLAKPQNQSKSISKTIKFSDIVKSIITNDQLLIVFTLSALTSLTTPVLGATFLYYAKYTLADEIQATYALTTMAIIQTLSLIFWSKLSNSLSFKKTALAIANGTLALAMLLAILSYGNSTIFPLVGGLAGFAIGGIYMLNWSILPDAIDYGEKLTNKRFDIGVIGLFTFVNKLFIGVSQALVGWILVFYSVTTNVSQNETNMLAAFTTLITIPILGALICILLLRRHRIKQT